MANNPSSKETQFINEWTTRIKQSLQYRKRYSRESKWSDYRKMYRGEWAEGIIPVNRIFSHGRALVPAVYFRSPRVTVTATHPSLNVHARVVEAVDNWLIRETKLKLTLKRAAMNSYITGTAPIKLGYDSEFGYNPAMAVDEDNATATQVSTKEKRQIEYRTYVKPGMPWAINTHPEDVVTPIGYQDPNSLPWIGHRIIRPLTDIQQDQRYDKAAIRELKGTRMFELASPDIKKTPYNTADDVVYGEIWEIRDAATHMIYSFCENKLLLKDYDVLQIEGLPWEFLTFNEDPEHFLGIPDIAMIEAQALELNETRTQESRHRKIALLKFLYLKGAIDDVQLQSFFSGEVGPGIAVNSDSLAQAVTTLQPHIPLDFANEVQQILRDMRETLGQSEAELGAYRQGTPPSAAEIQRVGGSNDNRIDERRDLMSDLLVNIIKKWNQYIFSFWTGERVVKIVGPDGQDQWIQYTGDELKGEYSLNIDPDSGFPVSRQIRTSAADGLLKQYSGDQMINQMALRQQHLSQFEWIFPGVSNMLNTEMPPDVSNLVSVARNPTMPGGSHGAAPGTNRGGGQQPGAAIPLAKAAAAAKEGAKR